MKQIPAIGTRVHYHSTVNGRVRECTGTVRAHYPGFLSRDENDEPYQLPDSVSVLVDEPLPNWWPYDPDPNGRWYALFAPDIDQLREALNDE